uniref:Uncharacterized protein n=1 Tax=Oryza punctata TaxID=4537 RepID=A0A0E0KVT1_ORYPU
MGDGIGDESRGGGVKPQEVELGHGLWVVDLVVTRVGASRLLSKPAGIAARSDPALVPLLRGSTINGVGRGGFVDLFPSRTDPMVSSLPSRADPPSATMGGVRSGDLFLSRSDPVISPRPAHADPPPVMTMGGSRSGGVRYGRGLPAVAASARVGHTPPLPPPSLRCLLLPRLCSHRSISCTAFVWAGQAQLFRNII